MQECVQECADQLHQPDMGWSVLTSYVNLTQARVLLKGGNLNWENANIWLFCGQAYGEFSWLIDV